MKFFSSRLDVLDPLLGIRSWGLILYGALPACLSLLGFVEIKVGLIGDQKPIPIFQILIPIVLVSLIPLFVTFLLVRAREREWYLTNDFLNLRSAVTTFLIVVFATAISGAAGIIQHRYVIDLKAFQFWRMIGVLAECFLFGVASLVFSSTLFATVLTKGTDLPGLPSSGFVSVLAKIRQQLIALQQSPVWLDYQCEAGTRIFEDLRVEGVTLLMDFQIALSQPGHRLAKKSLRLQSLESDLIIFNQSIRRIKDAEVPATILFRWQGLFADLSKFEGDQLENLKVERDRYKSDYEVLQRLRSLKLGG
jgi:hypothetical protein